MDVRSLSATADTQAPATRYHAFLLRLWCDDGKTAWHASLQATEATTRRGFANLDDLVAFLQELCCSPDGPVEPSAD